MFDLQPEDLLSAADETGPTHRSPLVVLASGGEVGGLETEEFL